MPEPITDTSDWTENRMKNVLGQLGVTEYWQAINEYHKRRIADIDTLMHSIDPMTSPTALARAQGEHSNMLAFKDFVNGETERLQKEEAKISESQ